MRVAKWISLLSVAILWFNSPSGFAQDDFQSIFNGQDLTGWTGNPDLWAVEDGVITGRTNANAPLEFNTFLIWEGGKVGDFVLELEYKISGEKANSGIQYRSRVLRENDWVVGGYQADIDVAMKFAGINYEEKGRGILALRGKRVTIDETGEKQEETFADAKEIGEKIKKNQWNRYRVEAVGPNLKHYINDQLMSEITDQEKGKSSQEGVLALQIHRGPPMVIQFKNLKIKPLRAK